jgi:vacuolar-type H+-ATPase subunit F/Vma7
MASRCVFIGDELSAAGWRLAGAECHTPALPETAALLRALRQARQPALILISAEYAAALPGALRDEALAAQRPPFVVVADVRGRVEPPDLTAALKRQLGLAE